MQADGHHHVIRKQLVNRTLEGPKAGEGDWFRDMELNLNEIRYEVPKQKKKKGQMKPISREDAFMMAGLQPACHAKYISNEYFLCVLVDFDDCACCLDLPDSRMPMTIIPFIDPTCFGFQPPA